jgi:hypothetical protein
VESPLLGGSAPDFRARRERPELPLFTGPTEYQRRVAVKFFVKHKSKAMIAKEENCAEAAVRGSIKKITYLLPPLLRTEQAVFCNPLKLGRLLLRFGFPLSSLL